MIEIESDGRCDADGGEEGVSASVVAGGDAPPILELGEHVLDPMALFVERLVIGQRDFSAFGGRNARLAASLAEGGPEPIAVIASVGDQGGGWRQGVKDQPRALVIAHLALAEQEDEGFAVRIANGVELRVQAAFRAPDTTGKSPFLRRLAAVR